MVSVVMVAYNSSPYIREAIEGVVRQKCDFKVQLVVCDDASTDNTEEIVRKYQSEYPHTVEYFRNPSNLGVQRNYLEALSHCSGKYITMCDADDYWCDRSKLRRQVGYMEKHPECALTYHRVINYFPATGEMSLSNGHGAVEESVEGLASRNVITNLSVMYRASCLGVESLPEWLHDVRLIDYALHMLVARNGKIHYMGRPMGVYRQMPTAIWSQAENERRLEMALTVRRHLIEELSDRPELTVRLEKASNAMIEAAKQASGQPAKKSLMTRLRARLSRLLPVPKP